MFMQDLIALMLVCSKQQQQQPMAPVWPLLVPYVSKDERRLQQDACKAM